MPVTTTKTITYSTARLFIDMDTMTAHVVLREYIEGASGAELEFDVVGQDFTDILGAMPQADHTRRQDIADVIYTHAIAKGYITGTIS
jgi:hypothetical protein